MLPNSVHSEVIPPITFGVFSRFHLVCPGSILSGEKIKLKSLPIVNFGFVDYFGRTISSVAPGYTVLSRQTNFSLIEYFAISSTTATI